MPGKESNLYSNKNLIFHGVYDTLGTNKSPTAKHVYPTKPPSGYYSVKLSQGRPGHDFRMPELEEVSGEIGVGHG